MFLFDIVGFVVGWNLLFGGSAAFAGYKVGKHSRSRVR